MKSPGKAPRPQAQRRPKVSAPDATPAEASPRVARRERRRARSREEIIEASRRVLLDKGVAATTLAAIAKEVGLTKAALYYYFPSKDAIIFELIYGAVERQSNAVHEATERAPSAGLALGAIIRETVNTFAPRLDDFRLAYLHGQIAKAGTVRLEEDQLARIRPLNERAFAGTAQRLAKEWARKPGRARIEPRLMAFLANLAALGLLTLKGMAESVDDPLLYSDEQRIEGFAAIFEAAAAPDGE